MGKSLDLVLPDFQRRYEAEAHKLRQLVKTRSFNGKHARLFLQRSFPTEKRRLRKRTLFHASVEQLSSRALKSWALCFGAIVLQDKSNPEQSSTAYLEIVDLAREDKTMVFEHAPDVLLSLFLKSPYAREPSRYEVAFQLCFFPLGNARVEKLLALVNTEGFNCNRLTSSCLQKLLQGDDVEWSNRSCAFTTSNNRAIDVLSSFMNVATFKLSLSCPDAETYIVTDNDEHDLFQVSIEKAPVFTTPITKLSRRVVLKSSSSFSPFAKAIKIEALSNASDIEFRFPFGDDSRVTRRQRASGRCIFCHHKLFSIETALVHLEFEHNFESSSWDFEFSMASGLLVANVLNKNVPTISGELKDNSFPKLPKARRYVHSETCEPLLPYEIDDDSEDEIDESWTHERTEMLINEFEDVTEHESAVMKYWNRHVRFHANNGGAITDLSMPELCESFVRQNRSVLLAYRREVIVHFLNLWDSGLLTQSWIARCIRWLD